MPTRSTSKKEGEFTIASAPPSRQQERFSMWEQLFDECRDHKGEWRRTKMSMKKSTASQLASDIRNAYRRTNVKARLKGLTADERWDAAWGEEDGEYFIWLRYLGTVDEVGR
jgi:hypothetical protein